MNRENDTNTRLDSSTLQGRIRIQYANMLEDTIRNTRNGELRVYVVWELASGFG